MKEEGPAGISISPFLRFRLLGIPAAGLLLAGCALGPRARRGPETPAGMRGGTGVLPVSQVVTPAGKQVPLPGLRPQALALSPDGRLLVTAGKTHEIVVVNPKWGSIMQRVRLPAEAGALNGAGEAVPDPAPDEDGQLSYTGLVFSPDGRRLYMSNVNGSIKVFSVDRGGRIQPLRSFSLPASGRPERPRAIPSGLAVSPDGRRLYATLNLSNRLLELDAETGERLRLFETGVAPYGLVLAGGRAWVSNWGGRRPAEDSLTGPAGQGTRVRVDPKRFIASEGSVSVIDLASGRTKKEILTGRHASGLALSPDKRLLAVANAAEDTVSVIDVEWEALVETIPLRTLPFGLFGASPNALAFDAAGSTLYVCNGTENAVAVVDFDPPRSRLRGLIPAGWFPGAILFDARRDALAVANIKGLGPGRRNPATGGREFNSHQYFGSLSLVPVPSEEQLAGLTAKALENLGSRAIEQALLPARPGRAPVPVPERVGEPSVFKHVIYIIKENRTYDQVLGDMREGNGEPDLCVFGEEVTPNQHALSHRFVLLDNPYCSGILSADGHEWCDSGVVTDYLEKSFAGFPRSYPDGMSAHDVDALAYAPSGFLWDDALAHGKTLRVYGEFSITEKSWKDPARRDPITFRDHWRDFLEGTGLIDVGARPAIESLRPYVCAGTAGWDLDVPDVFRAQRFIEELHAFEKEGAFPDLVVFSLPNDHTSGTRAGSPTPEAQVADNDLALGRIVEAVSRSAFWPETCFFVIEDDPQAGWDHVSGYRTTAYVISPYTRRGAVVSTRYNQPGILHTIELILGLPPMNQMDAAAVPLRDCFTTVPDFSPFAALPNRIPLDRMNPEPQALADPRLERDARLSAALPLAEVDQCDEDLLNHILWRARKGPQAPYPARAVLPPEERSDPD